MTPEDVAYEFSVDRRTVLKWAREGKLDCIRRSTKIIRFNREYIKSLERSGTEYIESPSTSNQMEDRVKNSSTQKKKALFMLSVDYVPSDGSLEPCNLGNCGSLMLIHSAPSKVAAQVLCRDAVKPRHPRFKAAMIAVNILDVEDRVHFVDLALGRDYPIGNIEVLDKAPEGTTAINAENVVGSKGPFEDLLDRVFRLVRQDGIESMTVAVSGYEHWNLLA